ncbi:MAG TPA: hypothetical protein VME69_03395, partial [Methylocella sp.]|nr:hypothetical protein [Methylocella sp.]
DQIIAEHHHRADFSDLSSRDLATLWSAPIILTTAVQFFETLAANTPAPLRKLHALPGSVVFLDEAHAALPTSLWPQNWRWLRELAENWSCSFVLASGSLARFWELDAIVGGDHTKLPELVPPELTAPLQHAERTRVAYASCGRFDGPDQLAEAVSKAPGPRLLILNTVQSAAVMARHMRDKGHDVLHLSTALCPRDRDAILKRVVDRLAVREDQDWTLVATSIVEAGVDLSFRTAYRERFSTASLIQTGGRANRHGTDETVIVHDFILSLTQGLTKNPAAATSAEVVGEMFRKQRWSGTINPAELVTLAMKMEMRRETKRRDELVRAERYGNYPEVALLGRVIETDTRLAVVDATLREQLKAHEKVSSRDLLSGSVQIWSSKIHALGLTLISNRKEVYWWPHQYDQEFLGYMEGALRIGDVARGEVLIV